MGRETHRDTAGQIVSRGQGVERGVQVRRTQKDTHGAERAENNTESEVEEDVGRCRAREPERPV